MRTRWTRLGLLATTATLAMLAVGGVALALTNVAQYVVATSPNPSCTSQSGPEKAVDGLAKNVYTDKWCALPINGTGPSLTIHTGLGPSGKGLLYSIDILHASWAGESPQYNTRGFRISLSPDGVNWTTIATVTNNSASRTCSLVPPAQQAGNQYVRLDITQGTQGSSNVARIYEVQAWDDRLPTTDGTECGTPLLGAAGPKGVRYEGSDHKGAVRFSAVIRHSSGKAAVYQYILYRMSFATGCARGGMKVPGQVTVKGRVSADRQQRFTLRTKGYLLTGRISGPLAKPTVTGTLRVLAGGCTGEVLPFRATLAG